MKKLMLVLMMAVIAMQGCSRQTTDDLQELGNDAQRDINKAARNVDDAVKDATD